MLELQINTTFPNDTAYEELFALFQKAQVALKRPQDVMLDCGGCTFLHQNAVAFLAGLIRLLQRAGCKVHVSALDPAVRRNLNRNGFLQHLGLSDEKTTMGNSIPFRQDRDAGGLMRYLREDWLGRGWVNVSVGVQDAIATAVWEIYGNAFEHGASDVGVFTCGQHYPQKHEIALTVVDFGAGIPGSVRTIPALADMEDSEAIQWAFLPGTTSKQGNRGMGLFLLHEFIRLNRGRVDILSHRGMVKIAGGRMLRKATKHHFQGTLLNIVLKQDEKRYVLSSEVDVPIF